MGCGRCFSGFSYPVALAEVDCDPAQWKEKWASAQPGRAGAVALFGCGCWSPMNCKPMIFPRHAPSAHGKGRGRSQAEEGCKRAIGPREQAEAAWRSCIAPDQRKEGAEAATPLLTNSAKSLPFPPIPFFIGPAVKPSSNSLSSPYSPGQPTSSRWQRRASRSSAPAPPRPSECSPALPASLPVAQTCCSPRRGPIHRPQPRRVCRRRPAHPG